MSTNHGAISPDARVDKICDRKVPALIRQFGRTATTAFAIYFLESVQTKRLLRTYFDAISEFCEWAWNRGGNVEELGPIAVSIYLEQLSGSVSVDQVNAHADALRILFAWFVECGMISSNPVPSESEMREMPMKGLPSAQEPTLARGSIPVTAWAV